MTLNPPIYMWGIPESSTTLFSKCPCTIHNGTTSPPNSSKKSPPTTSTPTSTPSVSAPSAPPGAAPSPPSPPPPLPSKLPYPLNLDEFQSANYVPNQQTRPTPTGYYRLTQSIVYLVQQPPELVETTTKKPSSSNCSASATASWLVKLQESEDGGNKFHVLSPVSDKEINNVCKEFSLLDFRFVEVCRAYYLKYVPSQKRNEDGFYKHTDKPKKVLFLPGVNDDDGYTVIALNGNRRLYYMKKGDEEWTKFSFSIEDIVVYKGRVHSIDTTGYTSIYDSDYGNQTLISNWWEHGRGSKTMLLENCGSLLSVDIELDIDSCQYDLDPDYGPMKMSGGTEFRTAVKVQIYHLNEEKHKWEIVNNLGDMILFLGNDCSYSISSTYFPGCKGNVVYHADEGIELKFEKEKPKVCYSNGYDEFINEGNDEPIDDDDDGYGGYGPNYWMCDCSSSSDDDFPLLRRKAHDRVRGASDDVLKALQGQDIGVFDVETRKLGSLLMFREGASAFWPPPTWFKNN